MPAASPHAEYIMPVDSFKFLPRIIAAFYRTIDLAPSASIPWTPLAAPLEACTIGLVTSAGLFDRANDKAFDVERERGEPTWGDPTFRKLPPGDRLADIGVSHLHLNTDDIQRDANIVYPIERMQELVRAGTIAGVADENYSFMGYQGFPPDTSEWEQEYGPAVANLFLNAGVHAVILTPA